VNEQLIGAGIRESEQKRKSRLLNIVIQSLSGALGVFLVIVLVLRLPSMTSSLISIISALAICGISYWLARFGKFHFAVYLFLGSFIIIANTSALLPNIPLETKIVGPLFYSLSVVAAGVLVAPVASFWFAGFGAATLLVVVAIMGGSASFATSGESLLGWGVVSVPIVLSFVLASMSWLFGDSISKAFSALRQRSEELQASEGELRSANEELQATEEELRASNEELQAANEELREAQEQLIRSEKLAAIGQLAGGVGHELRNPLGAIKNAVYYIKGKVAKSELWQKEPRVMEFLNIMDDEINTSNKIINDLLGFSRVGKPSVSPTRIEKVIEDALSHTAIPENIELTKKLDADLAEVNIDPDQIQQVLVNIVTNAVEAIPEGGKLTIAAREKDKFLEVEIADTGCGIPQETVDKIFDPLFTTKAKGIGLGLAVCKAIIDRHQGNIEVMTQMGKGTTFTIKLPLKTESSEREDYIGKE